MQKTMNRLTSEGTTGVPTGDAGLGGTGGADGTFPATTAASKSESLALTTKRRGGNDLVAGCGTQKLKVLCGARRPT